MLEESNYVQKRMFPLKWPLTLALVFLNLGVYFVQYYLAPRLWPSFPIEDTFALSLAGLQHGHVWQLLTYQFMHGGWVHITANLVAVFCFGRILEAVVGWRKTLGLYLVSGIVGGLAQILFDAWLANPHWTSETVVGASAGAFGLLAAFTMLFPRERMLVLLFFVIPLRMKARTMLVLLVTLTVVGIFVPLGHIGHVAHLGGALTGCLGALWLLRPERLRLLREMGRQRELGISASQC